MSSSRDFLAQLQQRDALLEVRKPVIPMRDLAAVDLAVFERFGKASLFDAIEGHAGWRAAGHALADRSMWAQAFEQSRTDLVRTLRKRLMRPIGPIEIAPVNAPVCAMREAVDLRAIPLPLLAEHDAAPQFTAIAMATDPRHGRYTMAMVRLQPADRDQLVLLDMPPSLGRLRQIHTEQGQSMPITLSVGADPALYLAGAMALGRPDVNVATAGALRGKALNVVTIDGIPTPADAEYVIAAEITTKAAPSFGAVSNTLGTYSIPQHTHLVTCNMLYRRADPIHWLVSPAGVLGLATELLVWEHIENIEGGLDVLDIRCVPFAGGLVAFVKLRARVQGQAKTALLGALSGAAYWLKLAIAVDDDIDTESVRDVLWSIASRTHAEIDVGMMDGMRMLHADPSSLSAQDGAGAERIGTRWFIDSTMPALSQPERRATFERAMPKNFAGVHLRDHKFS
jgi:4-hydroxy-3-polyprenylbenzoate decarboxylase